VALDSRQRKTFWATVRLLRALAPPPDGLPVRVSLARSLPADRLADCSRRPSHYLIRICAKGLDTSPEARYLLLTHEWAHALTWGQERGEHGDRWGVALALCWRIIMDELEPGDLSRGIIRALPSD